MPIKHYSPCAVQTSTQCAVRARYTSCIRKAPSNVHGSLLKGLLYLRSDVLRRAVRLQVGHLGLVIIDHLQQHTLLSTHRAPKTKVYLPLLHFALAWGRNVPDTPAPGMQWSGLSYSRAALHTLLIQAALRPSTTRVSGRPSHTARALSTQPPVCSLGTHMEARCTLLFPLSLPSTSLVGHAWGAGCARGRAPAWSASGTPPGAP